MRDRGHTITMSVFRRAGLGGVIVVLALVLGACRDRATACSDTSALNAVRQHVNATVRRPVASLEVFRVDRGEPRRVLISGSFAGDDSPSMYFKATGTSRDSECDWDVRPTTAPEVESSGYERRLLRA